MSKRSYRLVALSLVVLSTATPPAFSDCNTRPTAINDSVATFDDRAVLIDALGNDSDPDGQPLVLEQDSTNCSGSLTILGDLFSYQPVRGLAESCTIQYTASDGDLDDSATVSISVTVLTTDIFADSFESGNTTAWTSTSP